MPNDFYIGRLPIERRIPAVRLFQSATIALSPGSVVTVMAASLLWYSFSWLIGPVASLEIPISADLPIVEQLFPQTSLMDQPGLSISGFLLWPWSSVVQPAIVTLTSGISWSGRAKAMLTCLFAIGLWSVAGTIVCRRAAMLFAGNDESSIRHAIQYGLGRWHASALAPLTPLFAALIAAIIAAGFGLVGRLPFVGHFWLILGSPFLIILAGVMAFLLLVTAVAWPLMVAAVATDDCDSFGGLSRAYSGLTGRPWHALSYLLVGSIAGLILWFVVREFAVTTIWCAVSSVASGSGQFRAQSALLVPVSSLVRTIVDGVGGSFFWSFVTISYLLLRQQVDGVPLDRLALDDELRPMKEPLPVVGIPATDSRAQSNGESFSRPN